MPFTSIFRKLQLRPMLAASLILLQVFSPFARAEDKLGAPSFAATKLLILSKPLMPQRVGQGH
jgi:hypothetical protein